MKEDLDSNIRITPKALEQLIEETSKRNYEFYAVEITKLREVIEIQSSKLAKAREALEFYANESSWGVGTSFKGVLLVDRIIATDEVNHREDEKGRWVVGGRRAREALKEIEE